MTALLLDGSLLLAQGLLTLAMALATLRLMRGPRAQDRVLALDTLYVSAMLVLLLLGMRSGVGHYFDAALVIGTLGFVSTAALARFLLRGEVIE
ncbi:MAG: K+/H+ antiporter subunit F [Gammaproteobacteria bacterium]|nr:K+/H+ antiporter subunit F [Gammaproteobacteria bacterium]QOJ31927.1 MAG: K+/H+ antiporter subunit F [Gammaproteobacteria bacterium]